MNTKLHLLRLCLAFLFSVSALCARPFSFSAGRGVTMENVQIEGRPLKGTGDDAFSETKWERVSEVKVAGRP